MNYLGINCVVAECQGFVVDAWYTDTNTAIVVDQDGCNGFDADYCGNPSDMWPLIVEEGISISYQQHNGLWCAMVIGTEFTIIHFDKNPLRAAAIVYVMLKQMQTTTKQEIEEKVLI